MTLHATRRIKAVFFDLNNTLHDDSVEQFFAAVESTCYRFGDRIGIPPQRLMEGYLGRNREDHLVAAGTRDERARQWLDIDAEVWARTLAHCGYTGSADPAEMAKVLFDERLGRFTPFADVLGLLKELVRTYALGVVTNGQVDMQRGTLNALGIGSYFKVVAISGEVGAGKPSVEIFAEAARRAGVASREVAHIGDSLESDVAGARAAGMVAIWLNRGRQELQPHHPQPDFVVASLGEVAALLAASFA